ncbi:tyrosine-type recombinase/integrase [Maridesulfovibrio bastinii]|uniref:tyrosine-type recombinase/integrase n=1 Tax=Maridesulfovibrio bastinii TaxID=47157 RepID=UPI0004004830|nr:tyrosine-type recombinase/integrase [Maridesulfovibrio bastinii]
MLTIKTIDAAKPREKSYRLSDGQGLYIQIPPKGSKRWRFRYYFEGKEKMLSLGTYPDTSLKTARDKTRSMREILSSGTDPALVRKEISQKNLESNSFQVIATEWHQKYYQTWTEGHAATILSRLENNIFPWLGSEPIDSITAPDILEALRRVESRGAIETAHRIRGIVSRVFRYAIATGRAERDPAADLTGAIPPARSEHFPTITSPKEIGELLRAIEGYSGHFVTKCALQLAPLVFVRPGNLRQAEWCDIDLANKEWRIPASKMKRNNDLIVPLARQAVQLLKDIYPYTGTGRYVFPGVRTSAKPMSENTINAALRSLGYRKEDFTGHSFRSMASTRLNEMGWNPDAIELQLAHVEQNEVRAAYNHAKYLDIRVKMMQAWADHLDELRAMK